MLKWRNYQNITLVKCKTDLNYISFVLDLRGQMKLLIPFNTLSANPTKWSNTLKQPGKLPTNCLNAFDHFVKLALKGLT